MNPYELADAIEDWQTGANYTIAIKAGQMLRQQANRIAELEAKQKVTQSETKPVAWMMVHCENGSAYLTFEKPTRQQKITHTPHELYTAQNVTQSETKPVAWMFKLAFHPTKMDVSIDKPNEKIYPNSIPLYTSPQYRKLSDDEIDALIVEHKIGEFSGFYVDKVMTESMNRRHKNVLNFARAILRKAQEK